MARKESAAFGTEKKIIVPEYRSSSRMSSYEIIYDENKKKARTGYYDSRFSNYSSDSSDQEWTIEPGFEHRLDLISLEFYNSSKYDWVISDVNNIEDPIRDIVSGKKIVIPNSAKVYSL